MNRRTALQTPLAAVVAGLFNRPTGPPAPAAPAAPDDGRRYTPLSAAGHWLRNHSPYGVDNVDLDDPNVPPTVRATAERRAAFEGRLYSLDPDDIDGICECMLWLGEHIRDHLIDDPDYMVF